MVGTKNLLWVGTGALALAVVAAVAMAHPGHAPIAEPQVSFDAKEVDVPFDFFRGQRIFVEGTVNGTRTEMMLESGAAMTVIDSTFAERVGITGGQPISVRGAAGEMPGRIASGVSLSVGSLHLNKVDALIIDTSDIARGVGHPVPVLLGHEAFAAGPVTLNFPKRTVRFESRKSFSPPAGAAKLDLGDEGRLRSVKLSIAGLPPVNATLDLGNNGAILVSKAFWKDRPELVNLPFAESEVGGVGGLKRARRVTIPIVNFAGLQLKNVPATLNDDPDALPQNGANIGIQMIRPFVATIDYGGGALYLQRTGEQIVFPRERAGVRTDLLGDRLKVSFVAPTGPAAEAGLKAGDEIVKVNGHSISSGFYDSPAGEWEYAEAGSQADLVRADGSHVRVTLRDYY